MGELEEEELKEASLLPKLKLPFVERAESPEHPSTPPFQATATAAVPFRWEEQPGKPRPCSDIITRPEPVAKSVLELPPNKFTKTPSPTTVLDGPYNVGRPKFSSSFRFFRDGGGVHDSTFAAAPLLGGSKRRPGGFFGKLKGAGKLEVDGGGSCRFSPSTTSVSSYDHIDDESEETTFAGVKSNCGIKMRRNGSFSTISSHAHNKSSQLWTSIYQGIKHVMHWKGSKKSNKEGRE